MPSPSSTPARRRLTFKHLLFALVLGLAAWWGVGRWLSPRPLYTLRYPIHESYTNGTRFSSMELTREFSARPFELGGRHLRIEIPQGERRGSAMWEVRETATGRLLKTLDLDQLDASEDHGLGYALNWGVPLKPDGSGHLLYYLFQSNPAPKSLWRLDLTTDERRFLRRWPAQARLEVSRDCSTLLWEITPGNNTALVARMNVGDFSAHDAELSPAFPYVALRLFRDSPLPEWAEPWIENIRFLRE
jgi:hypothetical protein